MEGHSLEKCCHIQSLTSYSTKFYVAFLNNQHPLVLIIFFVQFAYGPYFLLMLTPYEQSLSSGIADAFSLKWSFFRYIDYLLNTTRKY